MTGAAHGIDHLARRLDRLRSARTDPGRPDDPLPYRRIPASELAERLASTLDGEVVTTPTGRFVRVDGGSVELPLDRRLLADLPGQPPVERPLVCLDTETTGLATAAGTVAFLIGLGWWEADRFRQVQLLLPDHAEEPALLDRLAAHLPADAWLVTYNGRGFDWPLLVTRYRLARRAPPSPDGHLDLLPLVRRVFRHRMDDARLRTVERTLLGMVRYDDVDGWDIPGRYLGFLRGGPAEPLLAVVRHNDADVRSLGRLLAYVEAELGDAERRSRARRGDLAGLARAFARERRLEPALACLDAAVIAGDDRDRPTIAPSPGRGSDGATEDEPWWSPRRPADFGGRVRASDGALPAYDRPRSFGRPWDDTRVAVDRAHLLRRMGRHAEAREAWDSLAAGPGRAAVLASIESAKLSEHRFGDPRSALVATERGLGLVDRRRRLGMPEPILERDLRHRHRRLTRRLGRRSVSGELLVPQGVHP